MNYRNKLMNLSLIALAVFSACSDEVENGTHPGKGDQRLSFAVSMGGTNAWKPTAGTRAASDLGESTYELEPVEMEGKVNGKTVYLTAEVTEGFPGDNHPMTRGTQITETNKKDLMKTFGVSAYTDQKGTPDYMYNEEATLDTDGYWYPTGTYYWPAKKQLSFYAWYPSAADGMTLTDNTHPGAPVMTYIVPDDVKKQQDVMSAVVIGKDNPTLADGFATTDLTFNHALSAVKFVAGDDLPNCYVESIKLKDVRFMGTYTLGADAWTLEDKMKTFTVEWNKKMVAGKKGTEITEDEKGETFFMLPQTLPVTATVEVTLNDGEKSFTVAASLGGTQWEKGNTYNYYISHNFVTLITTNDEFIAYVDDEDDITDQVAFFLSANASTAGTTGKIVAPEGITVKPNVFDSGVSLLPVKVTWPTNVGNYITLDIEMDGRTKQIRLTRKVPTDGDAYCLYSLPEVTGQSLDNDIIGLQNASQAEWIGMTSSPTYTKDNYYQISYENSAKGNIYLQTLSVPTENRFASLLATKEDISQNVMYCVQQKAFTGVFGFPDCENNISRESEKWNISVGGRFKNGTQIKARVVMDAGQAGVTDDGSLTYGNDASITCTTTGGESTDPYVKKRWDTQTETAANNGERAVHLQIQVQGGNLDLNSDGWYDSEITGKMWDWMTWGESAANPHYCFDYKEADGATSAAKCDFIFNTLYRVHPKHPFFGIHQWGQVRATYDAGYTNNPLRYIYWARNNNRTAIHGTTIQGDWAEVTCLDYYLYDPNDPKCSTNVTSQTCLVFQLKSNYVYGSGDWNQGRYTVGVKYAPRPTDDNPITED